MALQDPPATRAYETARMPKAALSHELKINYAAPVGEAALVAPDSIQWRVFRNPIAIAIGGVAAVLLEFADPRIRSGVWDHSVYKVDPIGRSRRTGVAALVGVYGPASVAGQIISGVTRMHMRVSGETPTGQPYRALDPELLNWVHATAAYGFLKAYDRFVRRVSPEDQARFFREGKPVAELYGVTDPVSSEAEFTVMMARMLPGFEPHPINLEFLEIIQSGRAAPSVPRRLHRALARGAVSLLPPIIRQRLDLGHMWDLSRRDAAILKLAGWVADQHRDRNSPAWQAAVRLGLPGNFSWLSPHQQKQRLARSGLAAVQR
jgi:uncharacterized protein (DUF2236 family)